MTDDTLREECLEFACNQGWREYYEETNELLDEHGIVDALLAFARAQQAKGLREAADDMRAAQRTARHSDTQFVTNKIITYLEAQATARKAKP